MAGDYLDRKTYWAVKNALTKVEHDLINFYEVQWALRHYVPTVEEVTQYLKTKKGHKNITQVSTNYYLARRPVQVALEKRGIKWQQHTQTELTATQVATAITMMNFTDTRANEDKLAQLGVLPTQYYAWLNDPQFKNLIDNLSDQNLANIRPTAITEFTKKVNQGDWNAIKYYLDVTGATKNDEPKFDEEILKAIVEVIQTHVKDPEVLVALANDLQKVMQNRTLEAAQPQVWNGETIQTSEPDEELIRAQKMLGVN